MNRQMTESESADRYTSDLEQTGPTVLAEVARSSYRTEFGAHLEANYPRLVSQLYVITLNSGEAHDLVQDAFARAWQRWSTIREVSDPTGWVRRMAVRTSAQRWRRMMSRLGVGRSSGRVEQLPTDDPQHAAVLDALSRIPPHRRRALALADLAHLPLAEVAEVEGVGVQVAELRVHRARAELAELMWQRSGDGFSLSTSWEDM